MSLSKRDLFYVPFNSVFCSIDVGVWSGESEDKMGFHYAAVHIPRALRNYWVPFIVLFSFPCLVVSLQFADIRDYAHDSSLLRSKLFLSDGNLIRQ